MLKKNSFLHSIFCVSIGLSLVLLPNCAKYKPSPLPYPNGAVQESDDVKVITRKLSKTESRICFDSKKVPEKYDVIQIYVENKSNKPIVLSSSGITLPIESSKELSKNIYRNTAKRVAGYGAAGLIFTPLLIPAAVDGAKSSIANKQIDQDVKVKVLGQNETEVIKPFNSVNKVIFVRQEQSKDEFNLTINDEALSKAISFVCKV